MKEIPKETLPEWVKQVKSVHNFHVSKLKENPKWRLSDTAKALKKSIGAISQELKVASWLRTHEDKLIKFEYFHHALEYIRKRKHKLSLEEI